MLPDAPDVEAARRVELERVASVVVSGLPNMTPIFMRIWLMKMTSVLVRLMLEVSFLSAWLISRACRPICGSPISPSISAFGVSAATESMTITSTTPNAQHVSESQCLLAGVGLGNQQLLDSDAQLRGVLRIERIFRVDKGRCAAHFLRLGDHRKGEGRLSEDSGP